MRPDQQRGARGGRKSRARDKAAPAAQLRTTPRRRDWLFRLLALTLVPILLLGVLELVLRFAGYGYPSGFFLKTRLHGRSASRDKPAARLSVAVHARAF